MTTERIYVASRASVPERPAMWRRLREQWKPNRIIVSSWIDEAGTESFEDLWLRIVNEVLSSDRLILYAEPGDFPLKGALVEVGVALGAGKPVAAVLPGVELDASMRPLGSWASHPCVTLHDTIGEALEVAAPPSRSSVDEVDRSLDVLRRYVPSSVEGRVEDGARRLDRLERVVAGVANAVNELAHAPAVESDNGEAVAALGQAFHREGVDPDRDGNWNPWDGVADDEED